MRSVWSNSAFLSGLSFAALLGLGAEVVAQVDEELHEAGDELVAAAEFLFGGGFREEAEDGRSALERQRPRSKSAFAVASLVAGSSSLRHPRQRFSVVQRARTVRRRAPPVLKSSSMYSRNCR